MLCYVLCTAKHTGSMHTCGIQEKRVEPSGASKALQAPPSLCRFASSTVRRFDAILYAIQLNILNETDSHQVACSGPDGKGYVTTQTREWVRRAAPALYVGLLVVKAALSAREHPIRLCYTGGPL
jgi:hypothetical protein